MPVGSNDLKRQEARRQSFINMERDKLDNLLRDKLDGFKVEPPADMWAKLDAELEGLRESGTFVDEEGVPDVTDAHEEIPPLRIRRPNRPKMNWRYVAVSAAACLMVVVMFYKQDSVEEAINRFNAIAESDMVEEGNVLPLDSVGIADLYGEVVESEKKSEPKSYRIIVPAANNINKEDLIAIAVDDTIIEYGIIDMDSTLDMPVVTAGLEEEDSEAETYEAIAWMPLGDITADVDDEESDTYSVSSESSSRNWYSGTQDITSDMRGEGRFAVSSRSKKYWTTNTRLRRTTPINTSLFAVNAGGFNSNGDIKGATMLSNTSSLIVNEVSDSYYSSAPAVVNKLKHNYPLSFGVSIGVGLTNHMSIETGLMYTYMKSELDQGEEGTYGYDVTQKLHYLGIPVRLKYDYLRRKRIVLYTSAGGAFERLVSGDLTITTKSPNGYKTKDHETVKSSHLQLSLGATLGVEIKVDKTFGVYFEPGIGYYIKNSKHPDSYRKEHPLNFTMRAGFRVNL